MNKAGPSKSTLIASAAALLVCAAGCVGPAALVALGVGGAWLSGLRSIGKFESFFIAATVVFLLAAFYWLYLAPPRCAPDGACEAPGIRRTQRIAFWVIATLTVLFLIFF